MSDTTPHTTNNTTAFLVHLSFSLCRQSRQLKDEAQKVEDKNHAQRGTTRVSLFYFQQQVGKQVNDALFGVKQHFNAWAAEHRRITKEWAGTTRLLPAELVPMWTDMASKFEEQAPTVIQEFFEAYPDWEVTAPQRMGSLYSANDFPTFEEVRKAIGWDKSMIPLPDGEMWKRVKMIAPDIGATIENLEASNNERVAKAVEEAKLSTLQELFDPIQHIIDVCSKDKAKIHETLIGNLNRIIQIAPAYACGDLDMLAFISATKETLGTVTVDDLRADQTGELRATVARNASELLSRFGNLGKRKLA